ncbi:hypothetical protein MD484_g3708, partial [Candolleomyces efflorescens]
MSMITEYSPLAPELSLALTNSHISSIPANSPLTYVLNDSDDFLAIAKTDNGKWIHAMDFGTANVLVWCLDRLVWYLKRCAGIEPTNADATNIPDHMYENLGMKKPRLIEYAERYRINPLLNQGDKEVLTAIFKALQDAGKEMVDWMMEARWQSFELGGNSLWNFNQPRFNGLSLHGPGAVTTSNDVPALMDVDLIEGGENEGMEGLQMVLHLTESRFAQHYPSFNVFEGAAMVGNGYIEN